MQIKLFTIPVTDSGAFTAELNAFLRSHKVLEVSKELVQNAVGAYWCFCINYIESGMPVFESTKAKVDYKEILDKETFEKFSKMRAIRKQISAEDNISAFIIFTDEELAELAKLQELNRKEMLSIKGIGEKKIEKFADRFIERFEKMQIV